MAAFDPRDDLSQDLAFQLMVHTSVTLFWRRALLDETADWLAKSGYHVVALDAAGWTTEEDLHRDIAAALDFPDYYGHNLNALNDCLRDVADQEYGWPAEAAGLVLAFTGYDRFVAASPQVAQIVLDIVAGQARSALLFGRRLLVLVQTDDPQLSFDPVGALPVVWNDAEWLDDSRRPG